MTREEAIKRLEDTVEYRDGAMKELGIERNALCEALDMAISALREQDVADANVGKTNADHIRSMTDEELASLLISTGGECEHEYPMARKWILNWLKQPFKENT